MPIVTGLTVSTMPAVALALPVLICSKLPPLAEVMVACRLLASLYTSSPLAPATTSVPLVWPSAMVIVPLSVTTVVTPCEAADSVAVKV